MPKSQREEDAALVPVGNYEELVERFHPRIRLVALSAVT